MGAQRKGIFIAIDTLVCPYVPMYEVPRPVVHHLTRRSLNRTLSAKDVTVALTKAITWWCVTLDYRLTQYLSVSFTQLLPRQKSFIG